MDARPQFGSHRRALLGYPFDAFLDDDDADDEFFLPRWRQHQHRHGVPVTARRSKPNRS